MTDTYWIINAKTFTSSRIVIQVIRVILVWLINVTRREKFVGHSVSICKRGCWIRVWVGFVRYHNQSRIHPFSFYQRLIWACAKMDKKSAAYLISFGIGSWPKGIMLRCLSTNIKSFFSDCFFSLRTTRNDSQLWNERRSNCINSGRKNTTVSFECIGSYLYITVLLFINFEMNKNENRSSVSDDFVQVLHYPHQCSYKIKSNAQDIASPPY